MNELAPKFGILEWVVVVNEQPFHGAKGFVIDYDGGRYLVRILALGAKLWVPETSLRKLETLAQHYQRYYM